MSTRTPTLSISPTDCLIDDKITIKVEGLNPNQPVTIATYLQESNRQWTSHAHYLASADGILDLHKATSIGGSYRGVEPMGLFWSISVADDIVGRLTKHDVTTPFTMLVSVLEGHIKPTQSDKDVLIAQASVARRYMGQHVTRLPVREGRIRGTLFVPKGLPDQLFPGVIDLYGASVGLKETRAALLASRGFVSLALPYFNYDDLPQESSGVIDLEYFEEAVNWLNDHPSVIKDRLGVLGLSKGGELALHISTITDKVKAVVSINCCFFTVDIPLNYKGVNIPAVRPDLEQIKTTDNWAILEDCFRKVPNIADCCIQVENSSADVLLIHGGGDDLITPENGPRLIQRLWNHGRKNAELHIYPGAGHLIEAPYTPLCKGSLRKMLGKNLSFGGEDALHAYAQEDTWLKVLHFFKTRLSPDL